MNRYSTARAGNIVARRRRGTFVASLQAMLSRESSSVLLLLTVLFVEAVVGLVVIRDLRDSDVEVERIYEGSVRGLRRIGELQYEAQETRRCTLYALTTNDGNLQVNYADQSREADRRVTAGIGRYLEQARDSQEVSIGQRLANDWKSYLNVRDEVLGLILENGVKEAVDLDLASGVPQFDRVRQDLEEVKRLYDDQASRRLSTVAEFSRRSIIKLTAAVGFCLVFGSIAISVIQRGRMRSTVHLARLQMDFVASVSHELRTPIAAILSAGENIRDRMVQREQDLVEQGSIITGQAARLSDLVDQVLLYAAIGKGTPWHDVHPLKVSEIVEHALRESEAMLREAGFTVEQQIQSGLPRVTGDLSGLSHCLRNLLVNAVKYSGQSRWVSISASMDEPASDVPEVRISVRDHGVGIGGADLDHVFEPFYRSPRVMNSQIRGTGLGLSIAQRSAEASGGRLSVESEEGVGSVFTLHLPVFREFGLASELEATGRKAER